jgi:hypothetical protein
VRETHLIPFQFGIDSNPMQSRLFEVAPSSLFRPLAAQGAELYSEVLLIIFELAKRHSQPLSRELAKQSVYELLLANQDVTLEPEETFSDDGDPISNKANAVLRYLERCGWLRVEVQANFQSFYTLPEYAFRLLQTLSELTAGQTRSLKGRVFAIYDLLRASAEQGEVEYRLPEAHALTGQLMVSLKELQHNIGQFIEQVLSEEEAKGVLAQFFGDYQRLLEERYHPLRTEDHVSRFRPGVLGFLDALQPRLTNPELAQQARDIREVFNAIDEVLANLDTRNRQYTSAAVRKIELYLTQSSTTSGRIDQLLQALPQQDLPQDASEVVQFFRLRLLGSESLYKPRKAAQVFEVEEAPVQELSTEERLEMEERMKRTFAYMLRYSPQGIRETVNQWLEEGTRKRASDIEDDPLEVMLSLIFIRHYQNRKLGYRLEETNEVVKRGNVGFQDVWLIREQPR